MAKGEVIGALEGHKEGESVEAIEFVDWSATSAVGGTASIVATGATDGKICIWDLTTMKLRTTLSHNVSAVFVSCLRFLSVNRYSQDSITSIHASPTSTGLGHHITSSSSDKTLKTWDTRSGQLLAEHRGHRGPVLAAAVGAFQEYAYVLSAGDDGVCLVFDAKL